MWTKIKLFFKAKWMCKTVTAVITGLVSAKVIGEYVITELTGSEIGDKVIPYIRKYISFCDSVIAVLQKAAGFVCGSAVTIAATQTMSLEDAIKNIDQIEKDMKEF